MIDDLMDEPEYDEGPDTGADYSEPLGHKVCGECQNFTAFESCGMCGKDLCPACFEMGGGFCSSNHTYDEVCAYEDSLYGPPDEAKLRQRQAHRDLVARGVLKGP